MLVNMKCPSCGATMQFDDTQSAMDCPYCGGKVANITEQVNITQNVNVSGTVVHVQDRSNDPNLFITYNTNNPSVGMVSRIVSTGVKGSYVNGQTQSYHLSQGPQTIILKIGKKNYSRDIVIPPDNQPVRIYASFNGRAQISVDQPNITSTPGGVAAGGAGQVAVNNVAPKAPGKPKSPLSILAFVLSLTYYLSWAGAALGAVETFVLDKPKEKNHIMSFWAMGIGAFLTICLIVGLAGGGSKKADTTPSTTVAPVAVTETSETVATTTTTATTTEATTEATEGDDEGDEDTESDGVTPELKAFLDSYEAYMDEYIEFMTLYKDDPSNLEYVAKYATMMAKYAEFARAVEKYDVDEMSEADQDYYIEVMTRINQKMIDASLDVSDLEG